MKFIRKIVEGLLEGFFSAAIVSMQVALIYYIAGLTLYESAGVVGLMMIYDIKQSVSIISKSTTEKATK